MLSKTFVLAVAALPLVFAHGNVQQVVGDAGGNGTGLAIKGAVVPIHGSNKKTEVDTTVMPHVNPKTNGLGKTDGSGKVKVEMLTQAMALSGPTLPQVSQGGNLTVKWLTVTSDGAGEIFGTLDATATGHYSNGTSLTTTQQIPGKNGNVVKGKRTLWDRALAAVGIQKRATNVGKFATAVIQFPADTPPCTGSINGVDNVCLVKIANKNGAGPFGSHVAIQMVGSAAAPKSVQNTKQQRREQVFNA